MQGKVVQYNQKQKYFHVAYDDDDRCAASHVINMPPFNPASPCLSCHFRSESNCKLEAKRKAVWCSEDFSYEDLCCHLLPEGAADEEPEVSSPPKLPAEIELPASSAAQQPQPAAGLRKRQPKSAISPLVSKRRRLEGKGTRPEGPADVTAALPQTIASPEVSAKDQQASEVRQEGKERQAGEEGQAGEERQAGEAGTTAVQEAGRRKGGKAAKKRASRVTAAKITAAAPVGGTKAPLAASATAPRDAKQGSACTRCGILYERSCRHCMDKS